MFVVRAEKCIIIGMKKRSPIRVTALQPVRIYAKVIRSGAEEVRPEFVELMPGETRSDISLFLGIDPSHLPGESSIRYDGTEFVPYLRKYLSAAFKALVQVEEVTSQLHEPAAQTA